jgi:hypothetical protein
MNVIIAYHQHTFLLFYFHSNGMVVGIKPYST